jgi:hypothetical protein
LIRQRISNARARFSGGKKRTVARIERSEMRENNAAMRDEDKSPISP